MNILITGGAGFIGCYVVRHFRAVLIVRDGELIMSWL